MGEWYVKIKKQAENLLKKREMSHLEKGAVRTNGREEKGASGLFK